ncbi:BrnA antitoxin family protein [Sphingomonas sp. BIUV-7]|uniref:BrnA antitoxin family protein n=1 Tax=Sphingomonas natans TaxID=3063330 RepID=A0ABT8Y8J1_9SPHN|nr:BrnA antitoxin family protein [Sphingomonas sp. BIUV-7]MDO6414647.1 BrnA antitoxin family protein [Sphingomonas sp. BIUV-7]
MSKELPPVVFDDDNPEWTAEDFARARPASEMFPPEIVALLVKQPGRPLGTTKEQVALRIDHDVLARFREGGPGWQTRMNAALRKAVGL